jgi:hypothetical protein
MEQEDTMIYDVLYEQAPQVESFIKYLTYWRSLSSYNRPFEGDFIEEACSVFLGAAIIAWCNVFADCKSHVYWSKLIKDSTEDVKYDFEKRIYKYTGLDEKKHQDRRDYIKTIRDKYFAHRDRNWQNCIAESPDFQSAVKIAKEYECWLNYLLNEESPFWDHSLTDIEKCSELEADRVAELLLTQKD